MTNRSTRALGFLAATVALAGLAWLAVHLNTHRAGDRDAARRAWFRPASASTMTSTATHASSSRRPNHLAGEKSPYLLQHLHNPVDWYPWGAEAFEKARREEKPVFLSI